MSVHDLQAPTGDGTILTFPPLEDAAPLARSNRSRFPTASSPFGRDLTDLRHLARREIIHAAVEYVRSRDGFTVSVDPEDSAVFLLAAGHQPELFHPGVWAKNFALAGMCRRLSATGLNLIVDGDTAKNAWIRLPGPHGPARIEFDRRPGETPYEEWEVAEEDRFADTGRRVEVAVRSWPFRPIMAEFWGEVQRQAGNTRNVGERFAGARRTLERDWGCVNLEVPMSRVCTTHAFAWFAGWLVREAATVRGVHNRAVAAYRLRHGLKSRNHPVPDLHEEGDWSEVPLWGWRQGERRRRRAWSRRVGKEVELRLDDEVVARLPGEPSRLVDAWQDLPGRGIKIRTRALTTTLFTRLFLADLFLHGLGGGKYDAVTDDLIRELFAMEPPDFLVVTATLRLPFPRDPALPDRVRVLRHTLRDLHFNPERHLEGNRVSDAGLAGLVRERERWKHAPTTTSAQRKTRFRALRAGAARIREHMGEERARLSTEWKQAEERLKNQQNGAGRDYAFCLHPEETLRALMGQFD